MFIHLHHVVVSREKYNNKTKMLLSSHMSSIKDYIDHKESQNVS